MLIAGGRPVSVARVSQIEHGEITSFEDIARYVEALGGRLDLVADFGDGTVRLPVTDTRPPHDSNHAGQPPPRTNRLSWHGCDSAFPPAPTHRQNPITARAYVELT
jgi:hypothetical protein